MKPSAARVVKKFYSPCSHRIGSNRKRSSTIDERGSKSDRNSVFLRHLSTVEGLMAIEISVYNILSTFVDSLNFFDCRLAGVIFICSSVNPKSSTGWSDKSTLKAVAI